MGMLGLTFRYSPTYLPSTHRRREKHMIYWAMRTTRDTQESRRFVTEELSRGRLRQGWGYHPDQDLRRIHDAWNEQRELTAPQTEASRHWRMSDSPDGRVDEYMNIGDVVLVPNMPTDGLFTLCRITGGYEFEIPPDVRDFGHFRSIEVLTPDGVANEHELVDAPLRQSLRHPGRLWQISSYSKCLERIIQSDLPPEELAKGVTPAGRVESLVAELVPESIDVMAKRLEEKLPQRLQSAEWETGILDALEPLFSASVRHTGGRNEQGADLEVVISNPFDRGDWLVPIQIKDHQGVEGTDVLAQLDQAYQSRQTSDRGRVIAVVLLVTDAKPSRELEQGLLRLRHDHGVPFIYCGGIDLMRILARGFLKRI